MATATTEIYTLSLHDALPISKRERSDHLRIPDVPLSRPLYVRSGQVQVPRGGAGRARAPRPDHALRARSRSEEHTSELQSRRDLVCRLLLEKKKKKRSHSLYV